MDFSTYDRRGYRTVPVREGYRLWAGRYEATVQDEMDLRLLERIAMVPWASLQRVLDLACGTGRIGAWLIGQGVGGVEGVDFTPEMLEQARERAIYQQLYQADIAETHLPADTYDAVTMVLADEHLRELGPVYAEAARVARPGAYFVVVGYHPYFLLDGVPTHFHDASGEPLTIECYVHLFADHVAAARAAQWTLLELHEGLVDDAWLAKKPQWRQYAHRPVSYAMVWRKDA